jgi:hydrogenase maturation protease
VGNPLFGDDGFGIEAVRRLRGCPELADWEILDGGTAGIYLLPALENRPRVVLLDAVNFGGAPGAILRLRNGGIPRGIALKLSEHQVTVQEVLALLELLDTKPADVLLVGVQPEHLRFSEPLSGAVRAALDEVCRLVVAEAGTSQGVCTDAADERAVFA